MLPTYGDRILQGLIGGKQREREHAAAVRELIPELEAPYARLLREWEQAFARTRELLQRARQDVRASEEQADEADRIRLRIPQLVQDALHQSQAFAQHLRLLREHSEAIRALPESAAPLRLPLYDESSDDASDDYGGGPEPADSPMRPDQGAAMGDMSGSVLPVGAVPIGGHKLPPLPYSYKALEPWIDEKTMRIHHVKHHQSYVDGLNKAETKLSEARKTGDFDLVKHWERELAFNGAGHYLHTIFWESMSPRGGGKPVGALLQEIERSFGSYDAFKKQFSEAANKVEGGGWAILVWSPRSHRLEILTAEKHQNLSQWDVVPLLPLDVWEHAYYLKHQNERAAYVKDWWNVVNWPYVAQRYHEAAKLQWTPW
ncbi:Fe-Mn family superoxide dismutase [Cohnella sp. GCM10027633]|uniref:superoxide dismutase n=1 Tax=unclassified Cohnella TaxID=2636738 RepID=UPI0036332092